MRPSSALFRTIRFRLAVFHILLATLVALPAILAPLAAEARTPSRAERAAAKDRRIWVLTRTNDSYALRYGLPGAADPVFSISCEPRARLLQFTVELHAPKVRSGDGVALSLTAGKRRLELAGSAFRSATEGQMVMEAAVRLEPQVLDLFTDGETLHVKVPGAAETFPLAGARARLADFRKMCRLG